MDGRKTARLIATAVADEGIPHRFATGKLRTVFAASAGPPEGPSGSRVSARRQGATAKRPDPGIPGVFVGVLVGVRVGVWVGVTVGVFVGVPVGAPVGVFEGVSVGVFVGVIVGVFVGVRVPVFVGV